MIQRNTNQRRRPVGWGGPRIWGGFGGPSTSGGGERGKTKTPKSPPLNYPKCATQVNPMPHSPPPKKSGIEDVNRKPHPS
uniref:Uncharacterized protein n=1 Tax=Knipowitschia caucasica TaxID=637954 RepID=A0AAV2MPQ0_KNICA